MSRRSIHLLASFLILAVAPPVAAERAALGELITRGNVSIGDGPERIAVKDAPIAYFAGDPITTPAGGSAELRIGSDAVIRIGPESRVAIEHGAALYRVRVERGEIRFAFGGASGFDISLGGARVLPGRADRAGEGPAHEGFAGTTPETGAAVRSIRGVLWLALESGENAIEVQPGNTGAYDLASSTLHHAPDVAAPASVDAAEGGPGWTALLKKVAPYAAGWSAVGGGAYLVDKKLDDDDDDDDVVIVDDDESASE